MTRLIDYINLRFICIVYTYHHYNFIINDPSLDLLVIHLNFLYWYIIWRIWFISKSTDLAAKNFYFMQSIGMLVWRVNVLLCFLWRILAADVPYIKTSPLSPLQCALLYCSHFSCIGRGALEACPRMLPGARVHDTSGRRRRPPLRCKRRHYTTSACPMSLLGWSQRSQNATHDSSICYNTKRDINVPLTNWDDDAYFTTV